MPYIDGRDRGEVGVSLKGATTPGELNYQLTKVIEQYRGKHGDSYGTFAEIVAALECAKLEFYRRLAAPYEDRKCELNGDVYGMLTLP